METEHRGVGEGEYAGVDADTIKDQEDGGMEGEKGHLFKRQLMAMTRAVMAELSSSTKITITITNI